MSFIAFIIGLLSGLFLLGQALTVLFFGLPFSRKLIAVGVIKNPGPIPRYTISLLVLSGIFLLVTWAAHSWMPKNIEAYWAGIIATIGYGLVNGMFSEHPINIRDYITTNQEYIEADKLDNLNRL